MLHINAFSKKISKALSSAGNALELEVEDEGGISGEHALRSTHVAQLLRDVDSPTVTHVHVEQGGGKALYKI